MFRKRRAPSAATVRAVDAAADAAAAAAADDTPATDTASADADDTVSSGSGKRASFVLGSSSTAQRAAAQQQRASDALEATVKSTRMAASAVPEGQGLFAVNAQAIEGRDTRMNKNASYASAGPIKAPVYIRVNSRFDYQPDVCKDFKETGYCGFGGTRSVETERARASEPRELRVVCACVRVDVRDECVRCSLFARGWSSRVFVCVLRAADSCKFLHDRSDYKSGWEQEREWEAEQARLRAERDAAENDEGNAGSRGGGGAGEDDDDGMDGLPFACHICREPFRLPVMTKCGHYFCQACALKRFATNSKCAVCDKQTSGIFTRATALEAKLKVREARIAAREAAAAAAAGDDDNGGDDAATE